MKSCTLPNIIVEPDNNSNGERGTKRPVDYEAQLEIQEIVDHLKVENEMLDNQFENEMHFEKKIKVKLNLIQHVITIPL